MPRWILNALFHDTKKAQEVAMDMPVLVPSIWSSPETLLDHFTYLCAYFHAQTALLIIQMVQFWSSAVITVRNINTTCFSLTVCNVSACALLVPSYSCLESIWEGKLLKTVYMLGMLHPWSTGAAAEQSYGRSMALTSVLCTCMLTFKQEWGAGQSLFQGIKWQDQTKQPQTVSGEA